MQRTFCLVVSLSCVLGITSLVRAQPTRFDGPPRMFMMERNHLMETLSVLGDLNLSPNFSLTAEQKQQIATIRDDFKNQQAAWRAQHEEELKKLDEQMESMTGAGGPPDPEEMRELMEARRDLMSTAPTGEEQAEKVKALLTPEQAKQFEDHRAAVEKEREQMMPSFMRMRGRR